MTILKGIGYTLLGVGAVYLIWAAFIPMLIGGKIVEREVIQQSPQYVISQRKAMLKLHTKYEEAEKPAVKKAIKSQLCETAHNIPRSEWPNKEITNLCR